MRPLILLFVACCGAPFHALAVNGSVITILSQDPDPNKVAQNPSAPVLAESAVASWSELLLAGGSRLNSTGGVVATDPRQDSVEGDFPVGHPVDVRAGTILNQGAYFVRQGDGSFLEAPALYLNGQTKVVDYHSTFPGIISDQNLQVGAGSLDDDGTVVFTLRRSQFDAHPVNAICRIKGGAIEVLAEVGKTLLPGTGLPFNDLEAPVVSRGIVLFYGAAGVRRGIYEMSGGRIVPVIDSETVFPAMGGVPPILDSSTVSFTNEGSDVALAFGDGSGVYKRVAGKWSRIARQFAPIPDGNGVFYYMYNPALHNGRVAFTAGRNNEFAPPVEAGIYVEVANGFAAVVNQDDHFGNRAISFFQVTNRWWNGSTVAFLASTGGFNDSALCTATVPDHPLTIQDDTFVIRSAGPNPLPVLDNDTGPWGTTLRITGVTQGSFGKVLLSRGEVFYTPGPSFTGADHFSYTVSDGDLSATANVTVNNPFLALRGSFSQVVLDSKMQGVGLVTATVNSGGALTGKLQIGALAVRLRGMVSNTGAFSVYDAGYLLELTFQQTGGKAHVSGTVSQYPATYTIPTASVSVAAAAAGITPGAYNLRISPDTVPGNPKGYGWAHLLLSHTGAITLAGVLGDGTRFASGTQIRGDGSAPLFQLLYGRPYGEIGGVLTFEDLATSDVDGMLAWHKPPQTPAGVVYPAGFQTTLAASGSLFTPPHVGQRALLYTTSAAAHAQLKLGDPAGELDATINVSPGDVVSPPVPNSTALRVVLDRRAGLFLGFYTPAPGARPRLFLGVQDQKANQAAGFFTAGAVTGPALFLPQ